MAFQCQDSSDIEMHDVPDTEFQEPIAIATAQPSQSPYADGNQPPEKDQTFHSTPRCATHIHGVNNDKIYVVKTTIHCPQLGAVAFATEFETRLKKEAKQQIKVNAENVFIEHSLTAEELKDTGSRQREREV